MNEQVARPDLRWSEYELYKVYSFWPQHRYLEHIQIYCD